MAIQHTQKTWQDKRILAMNRVIGKNKYKQEYYIEEYKKQYKGEKNV